MPLDPALVELDVDVTSPDDAIGAAGRLLVRNGLATNDYVTAMITAYHDIGPYIVLAPHIAMPHARPEHGGLKPGIAVLRLREPIAFGHPDNDPVRIVIPLVGSDDGTHIDMLRRVATVLGAPTALTTLESADAKKIAGLFT